MYRIDTGVGLFLPEEPSTKTLFLDLFYLINYYIICIFLYKSQCI